MSILNFFKHNKAWNSFLTKFGKSYLELAGYRRLGLKYDDLIAEENPATQEALRRLPTALADARTFRIRQAFQLSISQSELPREKWITPEEDKPYLLPIIKEVEAELAEKEEFDSLKGR